MQLLPARLYSADVNCQLGLVVQEVSLDLFLMFLGVPGNGGSPSCVAERWLVVAQRPVQL